MTTVLTYNNVNHVSSVNHVNSVNSISSVNSGNSVSSVSAVLPPFLMYFLQALILRTTRADAESWGESVVQIKHFEETGFCLVSKNGINVDSLAQCKGCAIVTVYCQPLECFIGQLYKDQSRSMPIKDT